MQCASLIAPYTLTGRPARQHLSHRLRVTITALQALRG